MQNNFKIELMQWQAHWLRGSLFVSKKNIAWLKKRNLENYTKMYPPVYFEPHAHFILLYFPPIHLLKPTVYSVPKSSCLKDKLRGFIFNNYC